jgi:hypothetical protein
MTIFLGLISCRKDKTDFQAFVECSMAQNLDSTAISAKLIGSWTWKKQSIPNTNKFKNADKNIKVTFNMDSTFSVTENSNVLLQSTWKLFNYGIYYGLRTNQSSKYLGGAVYFCDSQLLFVESYVDGVDNLFEK